MVKIDKTTVGSKLIGVAFTLLERDVLNGKTPDITISDRVQVVIDKYELNKSKLFDDCEFVI